MSVEIQLPELIDSSRLPQHIAIIMDGNGRWAKLQGQNRVFGHKQGAITVREITQACAELGIKYLTLYTFSTENWGRPSFEITALMELLVQMLRSEVKTLRNNNIRLNAIGNLTLLPDRIQREIDQSIRTTASNTGMVLTLALSYSARWEITEAARQIARDVAAGELKPADINENIVGNYLTTRNMPDPELLIRTSGELRISNYLLWQIAYTELYFTPQFWPAFDKMALYEAIYDYQQRDRRFGKV
ncbi:MAG: isoprenyl transferase [Sphingobacteriales bacterium]|jgi:undecaprenyl diphosphate synthase|nr:isoprenyl transferase [Sphingobacteriales bacterium]MBP9141463.1 isoprenyl transferase [Chitinophagales bacterium]MDA0198441.1 isoprenyl transferase [Bacteroidota bacterium]MBK6890902.1 isoprenyl transferase [Sphingobacteriales bacterium]MBK7526046.1 isoprenyl transferase [Sphingobacteriales bacterium]